MLSVIVNYVLIKSAKIPTRLFFYLTRFETLNLLKPSNRIKGICAHSRKKKEQNVKRTIGVEAPQASQRISQSTKFMLKNILM